MGTVLGLKECLNTFLSKWNLGPDARKLLRLYLSWPNRFEVREDEEARLFHKWLQHNYGCMRFVDVLSQTDISDFLALNPRVIEAAKFLKPSERHSDGVRRETRINTATKVFISVYECEKKSSLIGHTCKGLATDVTSTGLGIEVGGALPQETIINLTAAPPRLPIKLYRLTGEVRWSENVDGGLYQIGVKVLDMDDAETWKTDFVRKFEGA